MKGRSRSRRRAAAGAAAAERTSGGWKSPTRRRRGWPLFALLVLPSLTAAAATVDAPRPDLQRFEPGVQEVLVEGIGRFETASADPAPAARAEAWGQLGMLYQAHHLQDLALTCYREATGLAPESFRWQYLLAFAYQEGGDFGAAADAYDRALALDADSNPALIRRGQVRAELGEAAAAERDFRSALERDPRNAAALAGLGRLAMTAGNHDEAVRYLSRALEIDPRATRLHYPLAIAYRQTGNVEAAREQLALRGDADVAVRDPLLAEMSAMSRSAQVYLEAGYAAARAGRDREAVAQFRKAVAFNPDDLAARLGLGQGLSLLGDYGAAEAEFDRAVALAPADPVARYRRGTLYALQGRDEEAVADLQLAVTGDSEQLPARIRLADALMRLGRYEDAAEHYGAIDAPPGVEALMLYREGVARIAGGDCEAATVLFRDALAQRPDSGEIMQALARSYASCPGLDAQKRREAVELARQLFAARPDAAHAETLAMAAAANDAFERAVDIEERLLASAQGADNMLAVAWHEHLLKRYRQGRPADQAWPAGHPVFRPSASAAGPGEPASR